MVELMAFKDELPPSGLQEVHTDRSVSVSLFIVGISLLFSMLFVWIMIQDWMFRLIAHGITLVVAALGFVVGRSVYKSLREDAVAKWARLSSAIIIGLALTITVNILVRSHKLVRYINQFDITTDDDADSDL